MSFILKPSLTAIETKAVKRYTPGFNGAAAPVVANWIELLSVQDASLWNDRAGAGMTVSVDNTVLFNGLPTLRLDIPALSAGTYRVGTTTAVCLPPYNWDGKNYTIAIKSSNLTSVSSTQTFLGDVGFANFYTFGGDTNNANVPQMILQDNEWFVGYGTTVGVGAGAPTFTGAKRLRVNFNVTSDASPTTVWIGFCGVSAPKKTSVIISIDDGYASGYNFVAQVARYYGIPVSFGIDSAYVNTANYFTDAQIQSLYNDASNLFEFVSHGYNNESIVSVGTAKYIQNNNNTRNYLRSIGVYGDGPNHHPWVQSLQTNAGIAGLIANGFLSARVGAVTPKSAHDSLFYTNQDKRKFQLMNCVSVTSGVTLLDAQNAVTAAVAEGYGVTHINAHDFGATDGVSPPRWSYDKWIDFIGWLKALELTGSTEHKLWGVWYADINGLVYSK